MNIIQRIKYWLMQFRARHTDGTSGSGHTMEFTVICSELNDGTIVQRSNGKWTI